MPRRAKPQGALRPGTPLADNPVPGQTYGKETAQSEGMSSVPMAGAQVSSALPAPGSTPLVRPTERPNEPLTHGLSVGPGAGPEALAGSPSQGVADQFTMLAHSPNSSPTIEALAHIASTLGL